MARHNIGYMEMRDRIRQRMRELKINQPQLAEMVGLSQPGIQKILAGGGTRKIVALADALECSPEWLENGGKDTAPERTRVADIGAVYSAMTPRKQMAAALAIADALSPVDAITLAEHLLARAKAELRAKQ